MSEAPYFGETTDDLIARVHAQHVPPATPPAETPPAATTLEEQAEAILVERAETARRDILARALLEQRGVTVSDLELLSAADRIEAAFPPPPEPDTLESNLAYLRANGEDI